MQNKTILITGATSGIGKVAALELAKTGANIIIHGRNKEKTESVRQEITTKSNNQNIDSIIADLSLTKDIFTMAIELKNKYQKIDVLINNAGGIMSSQREITKEGNEKTFALNVIAPYLLTNLLLDLLKKSDDGKVIITSSNAHRIAKPDFTDFQMVKNYSSLYAYSNSKLYVILLAKKMNSILAEKNIKNIKVTTMHPGVVATNFALEAKSGLMSFFFKVFKPFMLTSEKGADTLIYLAKEKININENNLFYIKRKSVKPNTKFITSANADKLMNYLENITNIKFEA